MRASFLKSLRTLLLALVAQAGTAVGGEDPRWTHLADPLLVHHSDPEAGSGTAIVQDHNGFIWLGTQSGVVRWDGYHFHRYTADAQVAGSLPDSFILSLYVDDRNRLWVGTSAGGLARYDADRDSFVVAVEPFGTKVTAVLSITNDGSGGLWVGTESGLEHMDARNLDKLAPYEEPLTQGLPEGGVQAVLNATDGTLWVGTRHGLWSRKRGATTFAAVPLQTPESNTPAVTRLFEESHG